MSHEDPSHPDSPPADSRPRRAPVKEFVRDVAHLPPWQKKLFLLAGALAVFGLIGQASTRVAKAPAENPPQVTFPADGPAPRSGFAPGSAPPPAAETAPEERDPSFAERHSPWASRVGVGFMGGFVIGWLFRAFLKTMALVTAAGAAIFWGLAHFDVIDVQLAEERFKSTTSWVSAQAERLKDDAMKLVPSSASSVFGMFLGFRRR